MKRRIWRMIERTFSSQPESAVFQSVILKLREEGKIGNTCLFRFVPDIHVTLGYYEDATIDIDLDVCRQIGLPVKRRAISGGSAAILGPNYSGFSVCLNAVEIGISIEALYQKILFNLMDEISRKFKVPTRYKPLNDGEMWDKKGKRWRKIALSNVSGEGDILLFGGSVTLCKPRVDMMTKVLTPATKKFSDKDAKSFEERVGYLESEVGRNVSKEEIRQVYISTLERAFDVELKTDEPSEEEKYLFDKMKKVFIVGDRWTMDRSQERFAECDSNEKRGEHIIKIPNGPLFKVDIVISENKIKEIMFSGSMSCSPSNFFKQLEDHLRRKTANKKAVETAVKEVYNSSTRVACMNAKDISKAIIETLKEAKS